MKHFLVNNYMYSILCAQFFIVHHNLTNKNENCKKGNFLHLCNTVLLQYFLVKKKFRIILFKRRLIRFSSHPAGVTDAFCASGGSFSLRNSKVMYETVMFQKGKMFSISDGDFQVYWAS